MTTLKSGELTLPNVERLDQIAPFVAKMRIAKGVSQTELARRLGVSKQVISRYEETEYQTVAICSTAGDSRRNRHQGTRHLKRTRAGTLSSCAARIKALGTLGDAAEARMLSGAVVRKPQRRSRLCM